MGYADRLFDLTDRVILITGGSRGLGREMAFAAALRGRRGDRQPQHGQLRGGRQGDRDRNRPHRHAVPSARRTLGPARRLGRPPTRFGKVDTLINNAGMSPLYDKLTNVTEKLFDAVVNLNLKGPFRLSALVGERMVAAGSGSIINVSSAGSLRPNGGMIPYAAAKAGLNAMTEGWRGRSGPTVRVNTLMAGPYLTDVSKAWNLDNGNELRPLSLQRAGDPPEIVGAALFLASERPASPPVRSCGRRRHSRKH